MKVDAQLSYDRKNDIFPDYHDKFLPNGLTDDFLKNTSTASNFPVLASGLFSHSERCLTNDITHYPYIHTLGPMLMYTTDEIVRTDRNFFHSMFSDKFVNDFKNGRALFVIDDSGEGNVYDDKILDGIHDKTLEIGGDVKNIIMVSGDMKFESNYNDYMSRRNYSSRINTVSYSSMKRSVIGYFRNKKDNCNIVINKSHLNFDCIRKKYYICLNRRSYKHHRIKLINYMNLNSLIDYGYYSFSCFSDDNNIADYESMKNIDQEVRDRLPLYVDMSDMSLLVNSAISHAWIYRNSYFSIVTESHFRSGEALFLSEKIFKPMAQYHPFIIVGDPGTLKELHRLGYKTFHPHIDESYDDILDPEARMNAIVEEVKRLCNMSIHELHDWYFNMIDILEYNREHFLYRHDDDLNKLLLKVINKLDEMRKNLKK